MKLALFDIDGTLIRGSTERMFWRFLVRRGQQGPRQILAYLLFWLRYVPTWGIRTAQKNKAYLCGLRTEEVDALAGDFVASRLGGALYEPAVRRLKQHLNRGDVVVLMSGTLDCIARALAEHLGVKHVCATLCSQRNGVFLARPPEVHPTDTAKLHLARQLARDFGIALREASAYGNSRYDLRLLEAVSMPVAVRPDATLLRVAQESNWEVIGNGACEPTLVS